MSETSLLARLLDEELANRSNSRGGSLLTRKQIQDYSLTKVIACLGTNRRVESGLETELTRANQKIHDNCLIRGEFVPFDIGLGTRLTRDMQVGVFGQGGALVPTDMDSTVIPLFRNRTAALRLGATVIEGLRGNFILPRQTSPTTPQTLPEIAPAAGSTPTFDQISMEPHRISTRVTFSRQMVLQSSIGVEAFLRREIFDQIGVLLDSMILNGSGSNSQPLGIMETPVVGSVTFGGTASWATVLSFEQSLAAMNADVPGARMAWVSTPATRNRWKAVAKTGVGVTSVVPIFLLDPGQWNDGAGDMLCDGYRFASTNNIPNNQVIFGNWEECVVGFWGNGIDLIADPYTSAASDEINFTAIMYVDVAVRHPQSFCVSTDSGAQ